MESTFAPSSTSSLLTINHQLSSLSSPVAFLTDFPDRISPMLVKELRQGLRAKTFIAVFLSLQIFLGVMLFSAGAASTSDHVGSVVSGIIFTFFATAVLLVQPLRGISALSSEVKGNTIDMMVLTRLSAWRIVFGKWVAIVSQSALLLATIIPYLILRYFFGGMNLIGEMVFLILLFLTSMALTAVTVGLSGCNSVIVRALVPVFGLPALLWTLLMASLFSSFRGSSNIFDICTLDSSEARIGVACYVAGIVYLGGSLLSLGASLIAPAAENHAFIRRLLALTGMLALLALGCFELIDKQLMVVLTFVIMVPAIVISLNESAPLVYSVCRPFVKRGGLGKAAGWLFYPSWESGILFALLLGFLGIISFFNPWFGSGGSAISPKLDEDEAIIILSLFGSVLFPALWQVFFFRGDGQRVANYLLILVGSFVMLGILAMLSNAMDSHVFLWFFAWNPLAFIAMLSKRGGDSELLLGGVALVDIAIAMILLIRAMMEMKKSSRVIQDAEANETTA